ncbi:hypothetical protein THRCLA_01446 [Thraustotheca clavata]|uniref:Major Facilitator Superfamily (MFS) n=1 Tax=Thraustotheca clavata TaxID=74557 RepID=A0A1W0A899_9STRA|nr:hypothetical protein THRCLA_01446 [Thraustotheca clavata]
MDKEEPVRPLAVSLVLCVLFSDILFAGLIFGWAPMLLMLQEEDQYGEMCKARDPNGRCADQDAKLNMMYAIATFAVNVISLPVGTMLDYVGPKRAVIVAAILEITGLVMMAMADSKTFDVFVPAYLLLAMGGCITMMSSYPASFLIIKHQTTILASISCLFDSSSAIFLVLYTAHETLGWTRQTLFYGYTVLSICVYIALISLWHVNEEFLPTSEPVLEEIANDPNCSTPLLENNPAVRALRNSRVRYGSLTEDELLKEKEAEKMPLIEIKRPQIQSEELCDYPLSKQMQTFEFAFILIFTSLHVLRANFYIGTTNNLLEAYGDADQGYLYTKIFGFVLPMGFLFVPGIDYFVEKKGLPISLHFTNFLGLVYNVFALLPILPVQSLVFFTFTGFRAFLYAAIAAFAAKIFGLANLGTIVGLIFTSGSLVGLLQIPAVSYSLELNSFIPMYIASIALGVIVIPLIEIYRRRAAARERRHKAAIAGLGYTGSPYMDMKGMQYRRSPCLPSPATRSQRRSYTQV